jgi:hypothetical protein
MRALTVNESIESKKYLEVLHCTDTVEQAYSIWKNGFEPGRRGRGNAEGPGLFPSFVPPLPDSFYTNYGDVVIKFRVPLTELRKGYLIWDPGVQKRVWGKEIHPIENFNMIFLKSYFIKPINSKDEFIKAVKDAGKLDFVSAFKKIKISISDLNYSIGENEEALVIKILNKYPQQHDMKAKEWDHLEEWYNNEYEGSDKDKEKMSRFRKKYAISPADPASIIGRDTGTDSFRGGWTEFNKIFKYGYRGFCGPGRFGKDINYFGTHDLSVIEPISYTLDKGKTFINFKEE